MRTLFLHGLILDGRGGALEDGHAVVEGDRIVKIGRAAAAPESSVDQMIDLSGQTLLPGLMDCHVHLTCDGGADVVAQVTSDSEGLAALRAGRNARATLEAGITTVRDCGARSLVMCAVRRAIAEGLLTGPRLLLAGRALCMTGGHGWWFGREVDGPDAVRRAAREMLKAGADLVKVIATGGIMTEGTDVGAPQLTPEELAAAVDEAHRAGKRAAAHAHGAVGIKNAVRAGVDSIEHGTYLDDEGIALMKERGVTLVPTASAVITLIERGTNVAHLAAAVAKARAAETAQRASLAAAARAGVRIAMGTDAGMPFYPHGENARELERMTALALTPGEAITAATSQAAALLGLGDALGTIAPGYVADLLVVDGNPLENIGVLADRERIRLVMLGGRIVVERLVP